MLSLKKLVSPYFVSAYYKYRDIERVTSKYSFSGSILDVGCGNKPYQQLFSEATKYIGIDFQDFSVNKNMNFQKPDKYFPKSYTKNFKLPFKKNSFNNIVSFQVLEHHQAPEVFFSEIKRILKPGGKALITVPFIGGIHEEPYDFQRLTKYKLAHLCKDNKLSVIEISEVGSLFSAVYMLFVEYFSTIAAKSRQNYLLVSLLFPLFFIFGRVSLLLDKFFTSNKIFINYTLVLINE